MRRFKRCAKQIPHVYYHIGLLNRLDSFGFLPSRFEE